eukprot:364214-Rhodomonas_salina.1
MFELFFERSAIDLNSQPVSHEGRAWAGYPILVCDDREHVSGHIRDDVDDAFRAYKRYAATVVGACQKHGRHEGNHCLLWWCLHGAAHDIHGSHEHGLHVDVLHPSLRLLCRRAAAPPARRRRAPPGAPSPSRGVAIADVRELSIDENLVLRVGAVHAVV